MALSMDEQRMLDEMERQLAADDPRLASRFSAFGQPRLPGALSSQRAKAISGLLALVLIGAVTAMMFVLSPYGAHRATQTHATQSPATQTANSGNPAG